jgi:dihydroxyacetone kinase-like protein
MENADGITDRLLEPVVGDLGLTSGDKVLLFVNGMGGTPQSELYIVYRRAAQQLAGQGITVARSLVGNYITSLEMQGCSITVLRLDDEMTALWDAPVHTPALRWGV